MQNTIPTFIALKNGVELGVVHAVSYRQAMQRARATFRCRCEVIAAGNKALAYGDNHSEGDHNVGKVGGRRPYATPGFDERVAALREAAGL